MLNGNEDINTNLIVESSKDIISEMEYVEAHVGITTGNHYHNINYNGKNITEEEYYNKNKLVKKLGKLTDDEFKGNKSEAPREFLWKPEYEKDNDGLQIKNDVLPFRTIDVIFNKKNIFLNLQNPNPAGILFDIYNKEKWFSVLKIKDPNSADPKDTIIWKQDIPAFYSFKNFLPPLSEEEIDTMRKTITSSIITTIKIIRNQKNLSSFFKSTREIKDMLNLYLIFIEMKELGLVNKTEHKKRMKLWREHIMDKMPNKNTLTFIPLFFNYANETLISTYIEENCTDFLYKNKKDQYYVITCKIFQYPNRVLSVRLIICCFYKAPESERPIKDENGVLIDAFDQDLYQTEVEWDAEDEQVKLLLEKNSKKNNLYSGNNNQTLKTNSLLEEK